MAKEVLASAISVAEADCSSEAADFGIFPARRLIHHINPITIDDITNRNACLFDPNNVISTSLNTHNAIHYGDAELLTTGPIERTKNDTCPWKQ